MKTEEERLSLLGKFANGESIKMVGENGYSYNLHLISLAREDGSGKRFLFQAGLMEIITPNGLTMPHRDACFKGFLNIQKGVGWIKSIPKVTLW
ncbi:MAG: hypothetical protein PHC89_00580 [Candidatus Pacebacteria bacterium]|nr:hypothetical protein [Candidatus Paceibacterota bacterium]